jgi:hypothetical protein
MVCFDTYSELPDPNGSLFGKPKPDKKCLDRYLWDYLMITRFENVGDMVSDRRWHSFRL